MPQYAILKKPWRPHDYQKKAIKFLLEHAGAGLFLDPGLGKTSIVMGAVKILKKKGLVKTVLVIAPLRVCYQVWPKEAEKWTDFNDLKIEVLHGARKDKAIVSKADVYVINPAGLQWLMTGGRIEKLKPDMLVIDESTQFKHTRTSRFKLLKPLLTKVKRRVALTGSPAPNGLMDLFGQMYVIDLGKSLGQYITHYRLAYFTPIGFDWVLRDGAEEEIYAAVAPSVLRLAAEDYMELPEVIVDPIYVELPPDARRVYDEMEEEMITELLSGKKAVAVSSGAAAKKCEQIANGGLYHSILTEDEEWSKKRTWDNLHTEKIDAVLETLESLQGGQALVAFDFRHDLQRLLDALGKATPYIGGGVTPRRVAEIDQLWNRQEIPVLLGHPQSMGHGLNFQTGGNHIIWHSLTWNFELFDQFNRRLIRQGSIHKYVFVYPIIARNTIDVVKWRSLGSKNRTQNKFFDALKTYAEEKRE